MRSYIRHPSDIPIQVDVASQTAKISTPAQAQMLNNISHGGLAFNAENPMAPGTVIRLKIDYVQPSFEAEGLVTHSEQEGDHYVIGIEFISKDTLFVARMVEQVCHIEQYKQDIAVKEGRILSGEEATREWIERYAASFPQWQANG